MRKHLATFPDIQKSPNTIYYSELGAAQAKKVYVLGVLSRV